MRRSSGYSSSPRLFYQESHLNNLLGTLVRDGENSDRRLQTVNQLREWLKQVDPSKVNPKIVPKLTNAICRAFVWRHKEMRHELVECVRLLGRNLGDFTPLFFHHFRLVIDPDSQNTDQLQRFNALFPGVPELGDDEKSLILKPMIETIQFYATMKPEMIPCVVTELSSLLSHATSADVYIPVVVMLSSLLPQYSDMLRPYFPDLVDVSIGWFISVTQRRDSVRRETERFLLLMQPLWLIHPHVAVDFLMHFSEDIERVFTEYCQDKEPALLEKLHTLLEIFRIVCDSFTSGKLQTNTSISGKQSFVIVHRLLIDNTGLQFGERQKLSKASYLGIASFLMMLPSSHLCELFVLHQFILNKLPDLLSENHISTATAFLKMVARLIRALGSLQLNELLQPIFSPSSNLFAKLPFVDSSELVEASIEVFHFAFASKQVTLVTQIYLQLVEMLKSSFSKLIHCEDCDTVREERQLMFALGALRRIATDKLDLFGVHLFNPTIFYLLSREIWPFGGTNGIESAHSLAINSGVIQSAIFTLLVGHMQGHSYFVANSDLIDSSQTSDSAKRTSKFLRKFLLSLSQVLSADSEYIDPDVRYMALSAAKEVIGHITNYRPSVLRHEIIARLLNSVVNSANSSDQEALVCAVNCLASLFPYAKFVPRRIFVDLFEVSLLNIGSSDDRVANRVLNLVEQLAVSLQTGHLLEENAVPSVTECIEGDEILQISPFSGILLSFSNQFRYSQFQNRTVSPAMFSMLISYLLQGSNVRPKLSSWILDANTSTSIPSSRFYFLSWLTALCDLANHCVLSKLKTQLGKPQDTLLALELQLKKLSEEACAPPSDVKKLPLVAAVVSLDQTRRLIDLMDHLERAMYNAFEGTAVVSTPVPKHIRSFFVTNRGTCEEWLSRIRDWALYAAWASGSYEAAIRHGMEMLADWRRMGTIVSHEVKTRLVPVAVCLSRCFCKLRCSALILGLYAWCMEHCGRKLSWLKPAVTFCTERYEQCITQSSQRLEDFISTEQSAPLEDRHVIVDFLLRLCVDCFEALHDWEAYDTWRENMASTLSGSDLEFVATEIFGSQYLSDVSSLHAFSFDLLENSSKEVGNQMSAWGFDDLIKSVRQQNIRLIALITEQNSSQIPAQKLEQHSSQIRETVAQLFKVTTSASGLPSVSCLRDLSTTLMENCLTSKLRSKAPEVSLMASLCDEFSSPSMASDSSSVGNFKSSEQMSMKSVIDVITLAKFRQHLSDSYDCGDHCLINSAAVRLARKQGLNGFASKLLLSQLQNHVYLVGGINPAENADDCIEQLAVMPMDLLNEKCRSVFTLRCEYVKMFKEAGKSLEAADAALSFALTSLNVQQSSSSHPTVSKCCAKQLLLVAKWLQSDTDFVAVVTTILEKQTSSKQSFAENVLLLKQIMDRSLPLSKLSLGHVMNPTEHLIGQLLAMAANQSPTSSKAWMQLGGWCHFWGRKAITDAQTNGLQLSDEEYRTVVGCLPPSISSDKNAFNNIVKIITRLEAPAQSTVADNENNTDDDSDYRRDSGVTEQQLINISPILAQSPDARAVLLAVWRAARQRLFTLYNMAAVAYFSFVNLNPQVTEQTALASLRILRLLAKHAWELQAILETSLQGSPVGPWRAIIPQLFARLGHPEPYVRKAISDLLCRIATTAPHEIIYPAIAGFYAYGGSVKALSGPSNSPVSQPLSRSQQSEDLETCYSQLVHALTSHNTTYI